MKTAGWGAVNQENHILMFGCNGATSPRDCLASFPRASTTSFGVGWESLPGEHLRILKETGYTSSYWTRSSADGRFVAHGGASNNSSKFGATILDLQTDKAIPTNAYYDPGFFPDNSAFIFQGAGAFTCNQSVLTAGPTQLNLDEPGCSSTSEIGLYQHVGAALGGGDYWVVDSEFVSDDGGMSLTIGDSRALLRLRRAGAAHDHGAHRQRLHPRPEVLVHRGLRGRHGDLALVAPAGLAPGRPERQAARLRPAQARRHARRVRRLHHHHRPRSPATACRAPSPTSPTTSASSSPTTTSPTLTRSSSASPARTIPAFQPYREKGASNLYLVDLTTGVRTRITGMKAGQYALYPHFRSDGLDLLPRPHPGEQGERIVASDAALILAP